jgi:hypothetical protein
VSCPGACRRNYTAALQACWRSRVEVTAEALESKVLVGRVDSIGAQMGRKKTRTPDPAERSDRDILQVLVGLDDITDVRLVPELRVTARFFATPYPPR